MPESPSNIAVNILFEALERDQVPFLKITSDSMAPLLRQGDEIQLGPVTPESVEVGDVVVIGTDADLLAHRYWGALDFNKQSHLVTRGDRLAFYDPLLPESQLRAIVISRQRNNRLLELEQGLGSWLNRRLAQLAKLEARAIGLAWPTPGQQTQIHVRPGLAGRILRRLLVSISALLVTLVDLLA